MGLPCCHASPQPYQRPKTMFNVEDKSLNVKTCVINKGSRPEFGDEALGGGAGATSSGALLSAGGTLSEAKGAPTSYSLDTCDQVGKKASLNRQLANVLRSCGRMGEAYSVEACSVEYRVGKCVRCGSTPAFPVRCSHRLCSKCAGCRAEILISEHRDILRAIHYPKMLTLTFLSVKELNSEFIRSCRAKFTKLRHRKLFKTCFGGIYSFEFTYSEEYGWHTHIHALIGSGYIKQAELSDEWEAISGAPVCDIRAIKGDDKWQGVREVVKYPAKSATFIDSPALVNEFLRATRGVNLAYGFGALYRVKTKRSSGERMVCPICGYSEIDFEGGYGFICSATEVIAVCGGYIWRSPPAEQELEDAYRGLVV